MAGLITVRPARRGELDALYAELRSGDHEQVALERSIVYVAEDDEGLAGMAAARMTWQVEPLLVFDRVASRGARRRAARLLGGAMDEYLRVQATGLGGYYGFIRDKTFGKIVEHFGLRRVYHGCKVFWREV